jgi:hypothetical protein
MFLHFDDVDVAVASIRTVTHNIERDISTVEFLDGTKREYVDHRGGQTPREVSRIVIPAVPSWKLAELGMDGRIFYQTIIAFQPPVLGDAGSFVSECEPFTPTPYDRRYSAIVDPGTGCFIVIGGGGQSFDTEATFAAFMRQLREDYANGVTRDADGNVIELTTH